MSEAPTVEEWEVVSTIDGRRSDMSPGTFLSRGEAEAARNRREVYPELWSVRTVQFLPMKSYF